MSQCIGGIMKFIALLALVCSVMSFGYEFGSEVPEKIKNQVKNDLNNMRSFTGSGASSLHKEIFGDVDGKTYIEWLESRITRIGLNDCGSDGKAVACVIPFLGDSKIWLTKNYTELDHPMIAKLSVLYHEARHTETDKGNWHHARCPVPFKNEKGKDVTSMWTGAALAGRAACDVTPYGSYGSALILLKNISKFCSNCSEKVKMDAGLYADGHLDRIIDGDALAAIKADLYTDEK